MKKEKNKNNYSLKKSLKILTFLWGGSFLGSGSTFLLFIILAREFGPEKFGVFSSTLAIITIFSLVSGFGVPQFWLKIFGGEGWGGIRWLKPSFNFVIITLIIITSIILLFYYLKISNDGSESLLLILCFYIYGYISIELVSSKLQLEERFLYLSFWQLSPNLLRLSLVVLCFYILKISLTIYQVGLIYAFVGIVFSIISCFKLSKMSKGKFRLKGHEIKTIINASIPKIKEVLFESWPFGLGGIFAFIYIQSDIIMVKHISGNLEAGYYNTSFVILTGILVIPSIIFGKFLAVKYHRWVNTDKNKLYQVYKKGNILMLCLGSILMLFVLSLSNLFIPLLFGDNYTPSIVLVNILALALPISFLSYSIGATLVTQDNMKLKVKLMGVVALFNVLLNMLLVPYYGGAGAAISTVISNFVLLSIYFVTVRIRIFNKINR